MASVEATGATVDDAIDNALDELDLDEDEVTIEVLEEGGNGVPARIRATPLPDVLEGEDEEGAEGEEEEDEGAEADVEVAEVEAILSDAEAPLATEGSPEWDASLATAGREIVEDLLDYMGFPGDVDVLRAGKEGGTPTVAMAIVDGESMGALIGRRGETLQAMQFISQLLVNRRVGHWTRVLLDVEGYRSRRERYLKDAALRSAEKAMRFREPVEMDPMIPSERRIVHLTLADHADVTTHSVGEGPQRHVVVSPTEKYVREHGGPPSQARRTGSGGGGFGARGEGRWNNNRRRTGFGGGGYGRR